MGLRKTASGAGSIAGAQSLARWQEWIAIPGYRLGSTGIAWTGFAFGRHFQTAIAAAGGQAAVWRSLGSISGFFRVILEKQVLDMQPAAAAGGAREIAYIFDPVGSLSPIDFHPTYGPALEAAPAIQPPLSVEVEAWIRKKAAGDQPGARQFFGILNNGDTNWSRRVCRVGLAGNAAGGFRFQSNNCPDAPAGAVENAQTDADANSVAPAILVAPGVNWFHVRMKAITATESQTGRILCFLNGRLVATFSLLANMPRSSRNAADGAQDPYWPITPAICMWGNPDGVSVDPGLYMRDLRVRYVESWDAS